MHGTTLLLESLFNNVIVDVQPATLLKKKLQHRCFLVNFCEIFKSIYSLKVFLPSFLASINLEIEFNLSNIFADYENEPVTSTPHP